MITKQNSFSVDGYFASWGQWSSCSETCGGGQRTRWRNCTASAHNNGTADCSMLGPSNETEVCNIGSCPRKYDEFNLTSIK